METPNEQFKGTLQSGFTSESLNYEDAARIMDQSLFCKKVYQLIPFDSFRPSPSWIANVVGATEKEVVLALDALLTLGLIRRTENGYAMTEQTYFTRTAELDTHLQFTEELLGELRSNLSYFFNAAMASNPESIANFHQNLFKAIKDFVNDSKAKPKEVLYTMSFSSGDTSPSAADASTKNRGDQ